MSCKLAPSILSADFGNLAAQVGELEATGSVDRIHIDVMDGVFVPNLTIGPLVVEAVKRSTSLPLDVHLMIMEPHRLVDSFVEAGADYLTVHVEACPHVHRDIELIKRKGVKAGVSLNPGTPVAMLEEVVGMVDLVLLMTVDPGFGGQSFIPATLAKIAKLRALLTESGSSAELVVDGGINASTAPAVAQAGADVLVAGSAVFGHSQGIAKAIDELLLSLTKTAP
jgi:ribulose-phosphate 3-epimerase